MTESELVMLESLTNLSQEPSSERRREILQHVSQLFSEGAESFSDREKMLFGDILVRLLDQVQIDDRVAVSQRVAHIDETPHEIVLKLASDVAIVAAPVLEFTNTLSDSDLALLANSQGQDHLMAISRRKYLSETVTDIIVERGEDRIITSVARNPGAQFSQAGFNALAEKATDTFGLSEILANRTDLPQYVTHKIMPMLDENSRRRLQFLVDHDHGQVQTLLQSAQTEVEISQKRARRERIEVRLIAADIRDGKLTLSNAVTQLVREKRVADIAYVLSEFSGVPISQVANVFHKSDGSPVAAVCKAVGLDNSAYKTLSELRCEKLKLPITAADRFVREYEALDRATAERTIRFHKVRSANSH